MLKISSSYSSVAPLLQMLFFLSLEYYFVTNFALRRVPVALQSMGKRLSAWNYLMTIRALNVLPIVYIFIINHLVCFLLREELLLTAKHFLFSSLTADS